MTGRKGMTHYPLEVKVKAVKLHDELDLTYAEIAEQLGIRKADRIEAWCRAYQHEGEHAFHKPIGRPRKDEPEAMTIARLRMENALLKKYHTELRKTMLVRRDIGSSNTTEESTP